MKSAKKNDETLEEDFYSQSIKEDNWRGKGKERRRICKKGSARGRDQGWSGYKFKTEVGHVRFRGGFSRFKHALQTKLAP